MPTRIGPALGSSPPFAESRSSPSAIGPRGPGRTRGHDRRVPDATSHDPAPFEGLPLEIAGYRVVRVLGRDDRSITALVHADGAPFVARVLASTCSDESIDAEVAVHDAIGRSESALRDHVVTLHDLATLADGRMALILGQVPGPRLDDVMIARRGELALGEAITVLATVAAALESAHRIGLTGLGPVARGVRLRADGAPVIVRVQDARSGPELPERFRAADAAHLADRAAFERFGATVAAAVVEPDRPALIAALRAPDRGVPLAHALFDLADPLPLRLAPSSPGRATQAMTLETTPAPLTTVEARPHRASCAAPAGESREGREAGPTARPRAVAAALDVLGELGLPAAVIEPVHRAVDRALEGVRTLRSRIAGSRVPPRPNSATTARGAVRPRFVIAGVAGVVAVLVAVALAGLGDADDPSAEGAADGGGASPTALEQAAIDDATRPVDAGLEPGLPERIPHPAAEQWQAIVDELVGRWNTCRARAGTSDVDACGHTVAHAGSAAARLIGIDDDRHALLAQWSDRDGEAVVVERMGGAVIVDLVVDSTTTASLLVVRSEAGWRLRDVLG